VCSSSLVNSDVAGGDDVDNLSDEILSSSADKTWSQIDDVDQQQQPAAATESTHNDDDDVQQVNCPGTCCPGCYRTCHFLSVFNTNCHSVLHCFLDTAAFRSQIIEFFIAQLYFMSPPRVSLVWFIEN